MFKEFFEIAGIPLIRYGVIDGNAGICGARGFIFADCSVHDLRRLKTRFSGIVTGKNVRVTISTTRYSTFYAAIRWLWPVRSRGMGVISCFAGSNKSVKKTINISFAITVTKDIISFPKKQPKLYIECADDAECFLALLGGLFDGDGSISVYWSNSAGKVRRELELATTDEWLAKIVYNGIRKCLDENVSIYVRRRNGRKDLYKIGVRKIHVIEAIEPYVYHPIKRVKIAVALATSMKNSYPARAVLREYYKIRAIASSDVIHCKEQCKPNGLKIYAEALNDTVSNISSPHHPTPHNLNQVIKTQMNR